MPSFSKYMSQYDHEHTNPWNKVLHAVGIPIILAGILLAVFTYWRIGLALFVGGWILLFTGHRIEGNKPAFFQGVIISWSALSGLQRKSRKRCLALLATRPPLTDLPGETRPKLPFRTKSAHL